MAKNWAQVPVFTLAEFPPDALLVADVPKTFRLIMERLNMALKDIYSQGVKVGHIVPWFWDEIPDGALECNGDRYDEVKYAELFNLLGTNILPDLRGVFLRGWAHGSDKYDPDFNRALGSIQGWAVGPHTHNIPFQNNYKSTSWIERREGQGGPYLGSGPTGENEGAKESRPVNMATKYIIFAIGTNKLVDGTPQLGSLTVVPDVISGVIGQSGTFVVTPNPSDVTLGTITYTSSDPAIVSVTAAGVYTLLAEGSAVIAIVDSESGMQRVISVICYTQIMSIDVVFPATLRPNASAYPILTADPVGAQYSATYTLEDPSGNQTLLAQVAPDGKVTSFSDEGQVVLVVTATDRGGNTVVTKVPFNIAVQSALSSISLSIAPEIPIGTQALPQLVVNPAGLQVLTEYEVTYDPIFGNTVAIADKATGQVTGLYANAPATLKVTVRDLQGNVKTALASFVVTNSNWFMEKVYCRMDIVGTPPVFSNGQQFKVNVIDKLGVMDFTNISTEHLSGYSTYADLVSTVKTTHNIEYTLEFKANTPSGTVLRLDWLPTDNNTNPADTGWPANDPKEFCQCRNWNAVSDGVNSVGVPNLQLTWVNGVDVYNQVFKEAVIIDNNNFLDFTEHHGSNSITPVSVLNGGNEIINASMIRVPRIYFNQGTPIGTKGGIRWQSSLNPNYFVEDFNLNSLGNQPAFAIVYNTVDNLTFRAAVSSTTGEAKDAVKDRVFKVRVIDANNVTDFTTLQSAGQWNNFAFSNTYSVGSMTVVPQYIEFEIRLNKGVPEGNSGGLTWSPNSLITVTSNGITSSGETIVDIAVIVTNDNYAINAYNSQRIPVLVGSPTGKYDMTSAGLITGNGNVSIVQSTLPPVMVDGIPYLPCFLQLNTVATGTQQVVVRYDSSDTYSDEIIITGLGSLPSGANRNTNGLVLNVIKQFSTVEAKCSFTVSNTPGVSAIPIELFGDSGIIVKPGSTIITGTSGTFTSVSTGAPRTATVYSIPGAGSYTANSTNALLALIGG